MKHARQVPRFVICFGRRPTFKGEGEPTEGWGNPAGVPRSQTALQRFVFAQVLKLSTGPHVLMF